MELEQQITELITEVKAARATQSEEIQTNGKATKEALEKLDKLEAELKSARTQLDALDLSIKDRLPNGPTDEKTIADEYIESPRFQEALKASFRSKEHITVPFNRSAFQLDRKATISNWQLGVGTAGIAMPVSLVGTPLTLAQIGLRIRNIMQTQKMTTGNTYYWLKQNTRTNAASPQAESSPKAESTYGWTTASDDVKTIAHYTKVTRQALEDIPWLRRTIDSELMYGLLVAEENEILSGSGSGDHLNGIIGQATAYDTALNVTGDTKLDKLRHAKLQARLLGKATYAPSGLVLNPRDMHDLELIKSDEGSTANRGTYVIGEPKTGTEVKFAWGLPVVESDSMASGTFLIGAFATGAILIDRLEATIDISFENEDDFIRNKATIRAEERIGLAVTRPDSFVYGAF